MMIRGGWWTLAAAAVLAAGCEPAAEKTPAVEVTDAWARATAPGQETGGVFLTIREVGGAPDQLVGGTTPAADEVEMHRMSMQGSIMRMEPLKAVDIPAGDTVELAPGGTHIMLVELKAPLAVGQAFPLTLEFARAGRKQVKVKVRPIGAMGPRDAPNE